MICQDLSFAISDVYASTIATGKVTLDHRLVLKQAICSLNLADEEHFAIDRMLWSVSRGRLELVDD
ncbi:MAG: hypothetical protein F6K42_01620 [Leptolyngbya sp. SIO1D8]|nr:hypothetical protein [Leptolyngbya sp. SIO1D8]